MSILINVILWVLGVWGIAGFVALLDAADSIDIDSLSRRQAFLLILLGGPAIWLAALISAPFFALRWLIKRIIK